MGDSENHAEEKKLNCLCLRECILYNDPSTKNTKYHYSYVGKDDNGEVKRVISTLPKLSPIYGLYARVSVLCPCYK